ncbi:MAG: PAS domain-containing sensor histidine kinase [Magnetovibrio sp.]|nr:PAS domain-containing sensor histidine kinase [Magnetovibrio sp.]
MPSLFPAVSEALILENDLSSLAIVVNTVGGLAFLVAALHFVFRDALGEAQGRYIFATYCFMFGSADIVFDFSNTWDAVWWYWHALQLGAYGVLLSFFFIQFAHGQDELNKLNQGLEKRIHERTRDLENKIHEHKALQEQYRKNEERTRLIVNSAVDGIITIDSRGIIQTFNHGAEKIFGYSVCEVVGQNVSVLMPNDTAKQHDQYIRNYLDTGNAKISGIGREVVGRRKNTQTFLMDLAISEFDDGEKTTFVGIVRDITERKETEYRLNHALEDLKLSKQTILHNEQRLRWILDSSAAGITVVRKKDMKRIYVNARLLDMFGATDLEEFEEFGFPNTFANKDDHLNAIKMIKELGGYERFIRKRVRLDGSCWWAMQDARSILYENEPCIIVWIYDISDQKKAEENLIEAEKMASLGGLVAGVAHEVNTPIGVSVTASSHLKQRTMRLVKLIDEGELSRTDLDRFIETAITSTDILESNLNRASDLIRSFKQVAVDQSSEKKRAINLLGYVRDVLVSLNPYLKNTQHTVTVSGDEDISINTQPGAVSQLITNLIINSLTHAFDEGDAGTIRIEATKDGDDLILRYRDDGKGMDDDVRNHIFDPFFTTKRGSGGSGLGMNIVFNQVTQTLGGTVTCESKLGQGTKFIITIPQKAGEEQ